MIQINKDSFKIFIDRLVLLIIGSFVVLFSFHLFSENMIYGIICFIVGVPIIWGSTLIGRDVFPV